MEDTETQLASNSPASSKTAPTSTPLQRSSRTKIPTMNVLESMTEQGITFDSVGSQTISFSTYYDTLHQEDHKIKDDLIDPIAFQATVNKDILYYSQAMKATNRKQFQEAMKREFDTHSERQHWDVVSINDVPEGEKVLD